MRANMSEIGSVIMISPARLGYAGEFALERHVAQAKSAKFEVAVHGLGAATHVAAPDLTGRELGEAVELRPLTCSCHKSRFPRSLVSSGTACPARREAPWPLRWSW